ncbi:MAG: hypothetical protein IPK06_04755 [Ignavibacteriae bacterium]|nr:hypothetical protein [Ignavibacteriota bacterium]
MSIKKANYTKPITTILTVSKKKGIGLVKFGGMWTRKNKKGASFMMKKGSRKYMLDSFISTMPNKHKGIYIRFGEKKEVLSGKYARTNEAKNKRKVRPEFGKINAIETS